MVGSKNSWKAWLYLSPAIILLLIFTVWPIINSLIMAFSDGYNAAKAVTGTTYPPGIANFIHVFKPEGGLFPGTGMTGDFRLGALGNTILLTVITVPVSTILALIIAVALNSIKPLQKLYQTIFFLPYVTNSIAIGMVFNTIFSTPASGNSVGIFNTLLTPIYFLFGIEDPINWMNSATSPYWALIFVTSVYIIWNALPFKILILMGGLQSISNQYYDAAKVDGTSKFRVFTRITVPLLSPMLSYVIITSFIGGFKEYSSIVGLFDAEMAEGGKLATIVGYVYQQMADNSEGVAAAAALVLFVIIFAVTMVNLYVSKKNTHY